MSKKTIYNLKLHESLKIVRDLLEVIRVPGGWIYVGHARGNKFAIFVPFSNEFNPNNPEKRYS